MEVNIEVMTKELGVNRQKSFPAAPPGFYFFLGTGFGFPATAALMTSMNSVSVFTFSFWAYFLARGLRVGFLDVDIISN